jgi:hypothetical protein
MRDRLHVPCVELVKTFSESPRERSRGDTQP